MPTLPDRVVPSPGNGPVKLDAKTAAAGQGVCRTGKNDLKLLRLQGSWVAGAGLPRSLCDFVPGGGMRCNAVGPVLETVSQPETKEFLLGGGAEMSFSFYDAFWYPDNESSLTVSCLPYFDHETRSQKARDVKSCESSATPPAYGKCLSRGGGN